MKINFSSLTEQDKELYFFNEVMIKSYEYDFGGWGLTDLQEQSLIKIMARYGIDHIHYNYFHWITEYLVMHYFKKEIEKNSRKLPFGKEIQKVESFCRRQSRVKLKDFRKITLIIERESANSNIVKDEMILSVNPHYIRQFIISLKPFFHRFSNDYPTGSKGRPKGIKAPELSEALRVLAFNLVRILKLPVNFKAKNVLFEIGVVAYIWNKEKPKDYKSTQTKYRSTKVNKYFNKLSSLTFNSTNHEND